MAQWIACATSNREVVGSSPTGNAFLIRIFGILIKIIEINYSNF